MIIRRPIVQDCFIPEQYTSSPEIIKNCLKDVLNEGIMVTQVSAPVETEDMTKKQRETIIKKHMEQFTTKYYESDNRWHSFLPDETHPRKMKPIAKRKWEDLEDAIVEFYQAREKAEKRKQITLRSSTRNGSTTNGRTPTIPLICTRLQAIGNAFMRTIPLLTAPL